MYTPYQGTYPKDPCNVMLIRVIWRREPNPILQYYELRIICIFVWILKLLTRLNRYSMIGTRRSLHNIFNIVTYYSGFYFKPGGIQKYFHYCIMCHIYFLRRPYPYKYFRLPDKQSHVAQIFSLSTVHILKSRYFVVHTLRLHFKKHVLS